MSAKTYEVYDKLNPPVEEAFKVLRTNIKFCSAEDKLKSLAIVSCHPKEGKTSVAINLSISMARSGMKVLFVDADLRKPTLIKRLGGKDPVGLSNYLLGEEPLGNVLSYTSIENLYYISCGTKPPHPSELLESSQFSEFVKAMEEMFDFVVIDTSTLSSVIDGAIIASQTEGTLIVMASGEVQSKKARRLKEQLVNASAKIVGVVLNKVSKRDYKTYNSFYNNFIYNGDPNKVIKNYKSRFRNNYSKEVVHHD